MFFALLATATASAQITANGTLTSTIPVPTGAVMGQYGIVGSGGGPFNGVKEQPYSAQEDTETIQTLADGTHINNGTQKMTYYRDSLGRTRTERTAMQPPGFMAAASTPPVFIEIADPVAGVRYSFDSNSHTAYRSRFGPVERQVPASPPSGRAVNGRLGLSPAFVPAKEINGQRPRPEVSNEQLGTQTIEGVLADGSRTTTTYPVGFFGNDRPISTVTETWNSRDLGMAVLRKTSDPRNGETTMRLTNISRAEPSVSLFQPPADYEILDPPYTAEQK
jgi:hypothetical protein